MNEGILIFVLVLVHENITGRRAGLKKLLEITKIALIMHTMQTLRSNLHVLRNTLTIQFLYTIT